MAKLDEINYLKNIGDDAVRHAVNMPFLDNDCGAYLVQIGAGVMRSLGWTLRLT